MPRVRLIVSLGLPDPDRLSTTLLWSLLGHSGLLIGVLIYQSLPSAIPVRSDDFFVSLAAPAPVPAGAAAAAPAAAPEPPPPHSEDPKKTAALTPPPEKASSVPVPVKTLPPVHEKPPRPRPASPPQPAPRESPPSPDGGEDSPPGGGGAQGGPSAAEATGTGVGGTAFGEGDFRYGWYQGAIEGRLQSQWRKPLASSTDVQTSTVSFTIRRDGSVHDVEISAASGNSALDLSVLRAVYDANPLPALPRGWTGDSVHVSMEFRLTPGAP